MLGRLLRQWHQGPVDIVDVACGIGTQLICLARLGHRLTGSDISVRAVQRASRECDAADVRARLLVADMRSLPLEDSCADVVVCADNALPHLLADDDVLAAFAEMRRVLRSGGTAIVTTRDYDRILADLPASTELALGAGLQDAGWHAPRESGFFQPLMTAHAGP